MINRDTFSIMKSLSKSLCKQGSTKPRAVRNIQQAAAGERHTNKKRGSKVNKLLIGSGLKPRWLCVIGFPQCFHFITLKYIVQSLSHVQLFATTWTVDYQAPLSIGFSRQEFWSGSPLPSPEDLPDPGIEPGSPTLQTDALPSEPPGKSLEALIVVYLCRLPWVQSHSI